MVLALRHLKTYISSWFLRTPRRIRRRPEHLRPWLEILEERYAPATISDGGTTALSIVLGTSENLFIESDGASYKFGSNQHFTALSGTDPANQSASFSGFGTTTLTMAASAITQYGTGINITDAGAGASVTFNDSGSNAYANNFSITLSNPGAGSISTFGNSSFGAFNLFASTTLAIGIGGTVSSTSGNITLEANLQTVPTSGTNAGIAIGGTLKCTGTGQIVLNGRASDTGFAKFGVQVAGNIVGGTGTALVQGTGGANSSGDPEGVDVTGTITSLGGDVTVVGQGGRSSVNSTIFATGINVESTGVISAGGSGTVTVQGTGGATTLRNDYGVLDSGTITSSGGNVQVIGTGGGSATSSADYGNFGVYVDQTLLSAGGMGNLTVQGTGGPGPGGTDLGIAILSGGSSTTILANGGNINLIGQGGGAGASGLNNGVEIQGVLSLSP